MRDFFFKTPEMGHMIKMAERRVYLTLSKIV